MIGDFINLLKGLWDMFLDFIGFLFDIDFSEDDEPENPFENVSPAGNIAPLVKEPVLGNKVFSAEKRTGATQIISPEEYEDDDEVRLINYTFGVSAARYIDKLRKEVDYLIQEHNLVLVNSVLIVLPPQKLLNSEVSPAYIDNIIESIYSQYANRDMILKPGKINILANESGSRFAEMYIDCYTPEEEFSSV